LFTTVSESSHDLTLFLSVVISYNFFEVFYLQSMVSLSLFCYIYNLLLGSMPFTRMLYRAEILLKIICSIIFEVQWGFSLFSW